MGLTFTIDTAAFTNSTTSATRIALDFGVEQPIHDIKRFHVVGTNGNQIVRCGITGIKINCMLRYQGTIAEVYLMAKTDRDLWSTKAVSITDHSSVIYTRCNLISFTPTGKLTANGRIKGDVFYDVLATFTQD